MQRPLRTLLQGKWLALHLLVVALAVAMVLLGHWQLDVSDRKHFNWQNFIYAVQWWSFTGFLLFFWLRLMRDAVRPPAPTEATGELVVARRGDSAPGPGAALMVADAAPDEMPTVYRGYVMPQLSRDPDRTGDRTLRGPYNDHLWQLAMADAANDEGPVPTTARPLVDAPTLTARARRAQEIAQRDTRALPGTGTDTGGLDPADLDRG